MRSTTECRKVTHLYRYLPDWLRRGRARGHRMVFYSDKLVSASRMSQGPGENKLLLAPKLPLAETSFLILSQKKLVQDVS